ncbi:hypothetical protein TVAG_154500 [Trichomonas vaginalis G3]|uniref:Uncharacterized protein n=1 Tax=Trichomonas vaginalis (strain ATCC PRA-98 / G3) TaxID=412133 RepID=A2E456_TRIV3|nr:hypothetical protein TVAGG3_0703120 [Trichomonas vaginalis G3]EAY12599.1 hypothetical protein TVAG_154500 [Trichomonas vaginalis G3]KAI5509372.1 hypothetical protein TVAGG3_0703120 [Trichomonas vaginalis G3]|eukprot:XP_001324822.1 hypothetical protein [Trichomonas vaginalis G3]
MARYNSMRELARRLFGDIVSEEEFNSVYTREGVFIEEIPFAAQTLVWRARTQFNKKNDDRFHLSLNLDRVHAIETVEDITKEEMETIIKPAFANAYLHKVGITPTEQAIRAVSKMFNITEKNIVIHTRNKGYDKEEIIIKDKPDEYFSAITNSIKLAKNDKKCATIRRNIIDGWKLLDNIFPREFHAQKPKVYEPEPKFVSLQIIEKAAKVEEKMPSTLVKTHKPSKIPNPFGKPWEFFLSKEKIDQITIDFCDRFDFKKNFKFHPLKIEDIRQALTIGIVPRLLFHVAKYIHSIFVLNMEDISQYIRIRALWIICQARFPPGDSGIILSMVLVMYKVCCSILFITCSPKYCITNEKDLTATVFHFIDKMLNPFQIFDSMNDDERSTKAKLPLRAPKRRSQIDIAELVEKYDLLDDDETIARAMLSKNAPEILLKILSNEAWGDYDFDGSEEDQDDDIQEIPIQSIIRRDIKDLNWKNPNKVAEWMKVDASKLNLENFYRSQSSNRLTKTPAKKNVRKRSATTKIKPGVSHPSELRLKPLDYASPLFRTPK